MSANRDSNKGPHLDLRRRAKSLRLVRLLLAMAILGAGYLAWVSFTDGPVAGCGPQSGCNKVL